jgi:hypothetical protein
MKTRKGYAYSPRILWVLLITALLLAVLPGQAAYAVGTDRFVSTTGTDSGTCSSVLPCRTVAYAVTQANSDDIIHLTAGAFNANLIITKNLSFVGAGMNATLLNGAGIERVMKIQAGTTVYLTDLAIANGKSGENGGGIYHQGTFLSLERVKVTDNEAAMVGGGIASTGRVSLVDSVVRANTAAAAGGGVFISTSSPTANNLTRVTLSGNLTTGLDSMGAGLYAQESGSVVLQNVTITANTASNGAGGGIASALTSKLYIVNSTIARNSSTNSAAGIINFGSINFQNTIVANNIGQKNCANFSNGSLNSYGSNLDSLNDCNFIQPNDLRNTDPVLGILGDYGGFTQTLPLLSETVLHPHSPAIDAGAACPATDQRGVPRPQPAGGICDIGAYEYSTMPYISASDGTYTDKVHVTWSAVDGATYYLAYRSDSQGGAMLPANGFNTPNLYGDDLWAVPGQTYYYWVKGCNSSACSAFSAADTGWQALAAPVVTASEGTFADRVEVSWPVVPGATSYIAYRAESLGGTKIPTTGYATTASGGADIWALPGITYYYWVKACNGSVCSSLSNPDRGWR